ncbi:MAG TPA: hypothetical protein VMS12_10055, partial [Thermoanaerobaculia bacterium]|nr:hypothetical protein [Thermoanaerobaculia bacterium]
MVSIETILRPFRKSCNSRSSTCRDDEYTVHIAEGDCITFAVSTEPWDAVAGIASGEAFELERKRREELLSIARLTQSDFPMVAHLILAADQFIISPQMRTEAAARSRAEGHEPRTIIAGYHWFTD